MRGQPQQTQQRHQQTQHTLRASQPSPQPPRMPPQPPRSAAEASTSSMLGSVLPPRRKPPPQLWSTRTLVLLATVVGSSTFLIGMTQGYSAGKQQGKDEARALALGRPVSLPGSTDDQQRQ